jgi:hypothetical protein
MTTSVIFNSSTASRLPSPAVAAQPKSFRSHCIEDLSPNKISVLNRRSTVSLVAAAVAFLAFIALAVAAFAVATALAPTYALFVGLGALLLATPVAKCIKGRLENSTNCKQEAAKYRTIQNQYKTLSNKTPAQIQADLASREIAWSQIPGIQTAHPENLASLNPLLAQAKYLDDKIQKYSQAKDEKATEARTLSNANFIENRNKIFDLNMDALAFENIALKTKVRAAFVNAVLRKGDFNGTLETIADLTKIHFFQRLLANEMGNGTSAVNNFLTFKNRNLAPITYAEVKTMDVAQLAQRLLVAMPA